MVCSPRMPLRIPTRGTRSRLRLDANLIQRLSLIAALATSLLPSLLLPNALQAQSVGLPLPRLLTTSPMGGKAGTQVELTISGEHLDEADQLVFSDSRITAIRKLNAEGNPEANRYLVTIAVDCPPGLYESRVMTRLGISSSRAFAVGTLPELSISKPNTSLATAMELPVNTVCNSAMSARAVDYYSFEARKGQRLLIDCATRGIDSKLDAVVIVADALGRDLQVERRGGVVDFTAPADGRYVIKLHELTFKGGPAYYYRLALTELSPGAPIVRQPSTRQVNAFSWPPIGLPEQPAVVEIEPNNEVTKAQRITLPCDIAGSFFPAADVDVFAFEAKQGEIWWIEIGSERLGLPTDPTVTVQFVTREGDAEKITDVAELSDIPSPVKVSSNGYAYDGPPYNAGTSDFLGKLEIKIDGLYRLQLTDLFGGTRSDPRNVYRLVIRKATPDFALVAWPLHMELRNGDRNALSKPLALRGGTTMALEVIAFRRDGFDGDIELSMEGLPEGVAAHGLKIPSGQSRGLMLVSADENAPRAFANAKFFGHGQVDGKSVTRPCHLASVAWPIPDSWSEIPSPRLMEDVPVSVSGHEKAPLTLAPSSPDFLTVVAGDKLTVGLKHTRRSDFSGATMQARVMGATFDRAPGFDLNVTADESQVTFDTAALKATPGDYLVAVYGGAVAKFRAKPTDNPSDIADIVVSRPIRIRVLPAGAKSEEKPGETKQGDAKSGETKP